MKIKEKFKSLTGMFLALVLALTAFPIDAKAEPTIDTGRTGSLTIYQYGMADASGAGSSGTGETTDAGSLPSGSAALAGVQYTIYKVEELNAYYGTNSPALPTVSEAEAKVIADGITGDSGITDLDGKVTFSALSLGLYLVKVTNSNENVTHETAPFLVSIPMTKVDGTGWLYNVTVYPKSQTVYGAVILNKENADHTPLQNAEFKLQKKDSDDNYVDYYFMGSNLFTTNANGQIAIEGLPVGDYQFVETVAPTGYILDLNPHQFTISANGTVKVDAGKYVADTGTVVNLTVINQTRPTLDKFVKTESASSEQAATNNEGSYDAKSATQTAGKIVLWDVKNTTPANIENYTAYKFTEVFPAEVDYIAIGSVTLGEVTLTEGVDYTVTYDDATRTLVVDFIVSPTGTPKNNLTSNELLVINIESELNEKALDKLGQAIPLDVTLTYNNGEGTSGTANPAVVPEVHTGGINIFKYTGTDTPLSNAEFQVFKTEADARALTNPIALISADGLSTYTTVVSATDGYAMFKGIAYGTYYIVETKAPAGYNLLSSPVEVTVNNASHNTAEAIKIKNNSGFQLPKTGGIGTYIFTFAGILIMLIAVIMAIKSKDKKASDNK